MKTTKNLTSVLSIAALLVYSSISGAETDTSIKKKSARSGTKVPGSSRPTPSDPYPLNAAGWGPETGEGLFVSRWAEDWTGMRAAGQAPTFKAIKIGDESFLTFSSEIRVRYDVRDDDPFSSKDSHQGLLRGVVGSDLRINPNLRFFGELATGQVSEYRKTATANFQNDASLQQLFVDVRDYFGSALIGTMIGRQEYSDGPKQLISLSDGPNIHRTWNGVRAYAHWQHFRVGAFNFRATHQENGAFDEEVDNGERIQGISVSQIRASDEGPNTYWDSYLIHTEKPNFRSGSQIGLDERYTVANRLWGRKGNVRFDVTLAHQSGSYINRNIDAWGLFAVNSFELSTTGWKPMFTARIDIASGGAYGQNSTRGFNPLYASSNYLGEGQSLGLSNLLMVTPGISISPNHQTNFSIEYGYAQRLKSGDAVYAGGMRPYVNTQNISGNEIGSLLRLSGNYSLNKFLTVSVNFEHLEAGNLLKHANTYSGSYGYGAITFRY